VRTSRARRPRIPARLRLAGLRGRRYASPPIVTDASRITRKQQSDVWSRRLLTSVTYVTPWATDCTATARRACTSTRSPAAAGTANGCARGGSVYDLAALLWSIPCSGRGLIGLRQRLAESTRRATLTSSVLGTQERTRSPARSPSCSGRARGAPLVGGSHLGEEGAGQLLVSPFRAPQAVAVSEPVALVISAPSVGPRTWWRRSSRYRLAARDCLSVMLRHRLPSTSGSRRERTLNSS